jgi:hypothetical protein
VRRNSLSVHLSRLVANNVFFFWFGCIFFPLIEKGLQNKQALMDGQKALNDMIQAVAQEVVRFCVC